LERISICRIFLRISLGIIGQISFQLPDDHFGTANGTSDFVGALLHLNENAKLLFNRELGSVSSRFLLTTIHLLGNLLSCSTKLRERDVRTDVSDKVPHGTASSLKIFVMTVSLVFSSASAS
jgi:hypothetical protein